MPQEAGICSLSFQALPLPCLLLNLCSEIPLSEPQGSPETEALPQILRPDEGLASHSEERDYYVFFGSLALRGPRRRTGFHEEPWESNPSLLLGAYGEAIPAKGQLGRAEPSGLPQK